MGIVFNIQKYSLHDGPGIRSTVFLKGCPLRCSWCHNPESQSPQPEVMFFESRCGRCGACVAACPTGASKWGMSEAGASKAPGADGQNCTACGRCVEACAYGAREMAGRDMTAAEVMTEVLRDRVFYEQSGGGITFSGGEPLMQPEFLVDLLRLSRDEGLRTTVDTCGFAPWGRLREIAPLVDVFLYDVKIMDGAKHALHTGVSNEVILDNLRRLSQLTRCRGSRPGRSGRDGVATAVIARIPLVPGINDDEANIRRTGEFLRECGVRQMNVLPYHHHGSAKYGRLGREYGMPDAVPPSRGAVDSAVKILAEHGLLVKVGG